MAFAALALPLIAGVAGGAGATALGATTAGAAVAGLTAAGAVGSAASSVSQGLYQAQVAKNNAKLSSQEANYAVQSGNTQAQQESLKNAAQAGEVRAGMAANNVDTNTGSALQVQNTQKTAGELDTQTVMHNALLQAYGYQAQTESDEAQSKQDVTGGIESGIGGLLGNASALGLKWVGWGNKLPGNSGVVSPGNK